MKIYIISIILFFSFTTKVLGHGGEKYDKKGIEEIAVGPTSQVHDSDDHGIPPEEEGHESGTKNNRQQVNQSNITASFDEFPNLHPLVVHVPIMMLILAALLEIIGFFVFKKAMSWIVLGFVIVGFFGAYAAAVLTHPHVGQLPEQARKVYEEHGMYGTWTLWLSGIAVLLKIASHFVFHGRIWAELVVTVVLIASAYTVSMAGHHGSQLVFIEGVGPQGKYLESEGQDHSY